MYDRETGLYYLQSRYYNPTWGRFLNADSLVSTGQGVLGYNMFAYCNSNPISYVDDSGCLPNSAGQINVNATLHGSNDSSFYIVHIPAPPFWGPITPPKDADPGTSSFGITGILSFIIGISASAGLTFDNIGNIGLIVTLEYCGGPISAGIGVFESKTICPTIYDQRGPGLAIGASGNIGPVGSSVDGSTGLTNDLQSNGYYGYTTSASLGIGFPIDVHGSLSQTWVYGFNIYNLWNDFYYWVTQ